MTTSFVHSQPVRAALLAGMMLAAGCKRESAPAPAGQQAKPAESTGPVTINVIDAAGTLQLVQEAMESYRTKHPDKVEKLTFTKAPAPELPGKLKAMQAAG